MTVSDGSDDEIENQNLASMMKIPPGFYKVKVFALRLSSNSNIDYHIVFAPTDKLSQNTFTDIDTLVG